MTSIGTGYDQVVSTYSPDGRVFQVEYASKAVDNGGTAVAIRTKDGVVIAVEKIVPTSSSGWVPDVKALATIAADEAWDYQERYRVPIPPKILTERVSMYVQAYTLYPSVRPFGASPIIAGMDGDEPFLSLIETSGAYFGYWGCATGKARQLAKTELEKLDFATLSTRDALKEAARM
ncbi:hypothetical protein BB560_001458 [Smittium megazygosporum]|uniref:Proteasome subunit alpha type n=1 Tax=Smittium megazygosporum TaxID=133381 RepID=A0A2T9ZHJ7_9FUNG|nr:hypothetical protein BB560_001458 [Smittium megazygosporum]